jgi:polyisoprenoid-binding protein YceI
MKRTFSLIAALLLSGATMAQTTVWTGDNSHSTVGFSVDHMVISETEGEFNSYTVSAKSDKEDFSDATFNVSIDINSIDTRDEKRDDHLKAEDFLDAAKYPKMTFVSTKLKKVKGNKYELHGNLTLKGITKAVVFNAKYGGTITDPWGNTRAGFKITGEIDRQDFGVSFNGTMEAGGLLVGNEVRIVANIELIKQK